MSGIYISGMEMPEEGMCKTITIFDDGAVVKGNGSEKLGIAVPVPEHGRLIDETYLNMLIHTAKEIHANEKHDFCNAFDSNGQVCTEWWCVEDMIENAPTIIPADQAEEGE